MDTVNDDSQIIEIAITKHMINAINEKTNGLKTLNSKTLVNGEGNRSGVAGELIVASYLNTLNHVAGEYNYDFIDPATSFKIDVKSKGNSYRPRIDYDCTIPAYQKFQNCDIYIFTRISKDESYGWINGWIRKEDFEKNSVIRKQGSNYNNAGRKSVGEHKVLFINQLYPIELLKTFLERKNGKQS
jgi:hypothetical protein